MLHLAALDALRHRVADDEGGAGNEARVALVLAWRVGADADQRDVLARRDVLLLQDRLSCWRRGQDEAGAVNGFDGDRARRPGRQLCNPRFLWITLLKRFQLNARQRELRHIL